MIQTKERVHLPNRKITAKKIDVRKTNELLKYAKGLNNRIAIYDRKKGRTA